MIQANELRIGNFVNRKYYNHHPVCPSYEYDSCIVVRVNINNVNLQLKCKTILKQMECEGIPLTEQILLDCGAYQLPHFTIMNTFYFDLGRNRQLSIGAIGTPNLMVFIQEIEKDEDGKAFMVNDIICVHNWDYDGELHLHQLQNLIHALTGNELTYNPK